jgi:serine/threonine protein kinase
MDLKRIGRYDIKSLIGQGGMSAVYLGYDPRSQREVAVKILPPYYLHAPKFRERFEREALMIALLEHPAIVPVYDMGEEDGQPYIVMRYMSGGSLSDKLKKGPIPLRECMDMYLRLAPALDTAHARGVIHRDVKPDNLLFDKYDNVFLSDFGLARLKETIGFANISDGTIMGTPAYMSPEQIQGDRELDGRSDIYSLGVVLYQMLCGSVPFSGSTAASVMMMHLVNPVPDISDENKSLPPAVQSVLETALAKNPKDRYQTAGEFARAIQAITTGVQRKLSPQAAQSLINPRTAGRHTAAFPTELTTVQNGQAVAAAAPPLPAKSDKTPPASGQTRPQPATVPSTNPRLSDAQQRRYALPWWGLTLGLIVILLVSITLILRSLGIFPFSSLANPGNPTNQPQAQIAATYSPAGATSLVPAVPGLADKVAFLKSSEIWAANMDGSGLVELTHDGEQKSNLHWSPDGQSILYTSANCLKLVGLVTQQVLNLTCFSTITSITSFDVSPDGQKAALGLAQSELYLLPYTQLFNLHQSSLPADLQPLAQCTYYAPYNTSKVLKSARWSLDNARLALLLSTTVDGTRHDEVSLVDFEQCSSSPQVIKEITPTYFLFTLPGYYDHPELSGLSWNGTDQLLLNSGSDPASFGDLQVYNLARNQSQGLAPNGPCCYRDARWSPDGSYLFYSYQPQTGGDIRLYYTPSSELSRPGTQMASLVLPDGFLSAGAEALQPTLRAAH